MAFESYSARFKDYDRFHRRFFDNGSNGKTIKKAEKRQFAADTLILRLPRLTPFKIDEESSGSHFKIRGFQRLY